MLTCNGCWALSAVAPTVQAETRVKRQKQEMVFTGSSSFLMERCSRAMHASPPAILALEQKTVRGSRALFVIIVSGFLRVRLQHRRHRRFAHRILPQNHVELFRGRAILAAKVHLHARLCAYRVF